MEKRLTADLNVVSNSNLEIQLLDGDLNIIQKLDDEPNDVGGLTSAELKAKFDESGNIIKKYINETLIPAVLTDDATEESRKQAEAARVAAEQGRVTAEEGRVSAESGRVSAEQARANAEASRVSAETARVQAETARADETAGIVARATAQANAAAGSASQAAGSEQAAQSAANTASSAASSASQSASAASGSASQAQASAAAAAQSAASVDGINKTAQSWAVGGTNTRPGEDTDNAKYWAKQAQTAVGGDFATKTDAQGYVDTHNQSAEAHADIRSAVAGSVRYNAAQSLSDAQKAQARTNINAAPGGFGLGTTGQAVTDFDTVHLNGWYYGAPGTAHAPDSENGWSVRVTNIGNSNVICIQDAYTAVNTNKYLHCRRLVYINTATQNNPWEWVNPLMALGIEYRTTERYLGKPVYAKTFNIPTSIFTNQGVDYAHGITNLDRIVNTFVYCRADSARIFPWAYYGSADWSAQYMISGSTVHFELGSAALNRINDFSNGVDVTLKYTKTTD